MSLKRKLIVRTADPLAEITVYDGAFNRKGRGVGRLAAALPDGLYQVRARLGGGVQEKLISLDQDLTIRFDPVLFASAIPLQPGGTGATDQQGAVDRALADPQRLGKGGDSGLLLVVRDRRGKEPRWPGSPASGVTLVGPDGARAFDLGAQARVDRTGKAAVAAVYLDVAPGVYRLRIDLPDGSARERSVVASRGWRTECFMVRRRIHEQRVADLDQGTVSMARLGEGFSENEDRMRLAEAARDALAHYRQVAEEAAKALLRLKFQDPMLGLLVAHLLLRDKPKARVLWQVRANLIRLLGEDHPDVRAIALGTPQDQPGKPIEAMPMLRASWDRIVEHSLDRADLVPEQSPAGQVSMRVLPSAPWLVWEPADAPSRRVDAKMAALRNFVSGAPEPAPIGAVFEMAVGPPPGLDAGDRQELAHSLGLPGAMLDAMMAKLDQPK